MLKVFNAVSVIFAIETFDFFNLAIFQTLTDIRDFQLWGIITAFNSYICIMVKKVDLDDEALKAGLFKRCLIMIRVSLFDAFYRMFDFSGRTSRAPYWIASTIFGLCAVFSLACEIWSTSWQLGEFETLVTYAFKVCRYVSISLLFSLFVRRNHDLGDSILDVFNPFNRQNNLIFGNTVWDAGQPKDNKFGPPHSLW